MHFVPCTKILFIYNQPHTSYFTRFATRQKIINFNKSVWFVRSEKKLGLTNRCRKKRQAKFERFVSFILNSVCVCGGGHERILPANRKLYLLRFWLRVPHKSLFAKLRKKIKIKS